MNQIQLQIQNERQQYRRLNNLLNTNAQVLQMINFIQSNRTQYPQGVDQQRYLIKSQMFNVINGTLVYVPLNLRYVLENDIQFILTELYEDQTQGLGRGIDAFYKYICSRYLGISRARVAAFLKTQKWYNITRPKKTNPRYSLPTYTACRQAYAIDLIDMNFMGNLHGYRYIVNVMDLFSKYVFLGGLTTKDQVTDFFDVRIIATGLRPQLLYSDRGTEFEGAFNQLMIQNNIQRIRNPPHNPVKPIEAMNGNIRRLLKQLFTINGNTQWHNQMHVIQTSLNNYRSRQNGNGKFTPAQIFNGQNQNVLAEVEERTKMRKRHTEMPEAKFQVNQEVHVSLIALNDAIAKKNKDGELKNVAIIWSPEVFRIFQVIAPVENIGHYRYIIRNLGGQTLANHTNNAKLFLESDLVDASTEIQPENQYNYNQMMTLINRIPNPVGFRYVQQL